MLRPRATLKTKDPIHKVGYQVGYRLDASGWGIDRTQAPHRDLGAELFLDERDELVVMRPMLNVTRTNRQRMTAPRAESNGDRGRATIVDRQAIGSILASNHKSVWAKERIAPVYSVRVRA